MKDELCRACGCTVNDYTKCKKCSLTTSTICNCCKKIDYTQTHFHEK
jgi:hypothetical protein